jgi:hypothetical protein
MGVAKCQNCGMSLVSDAGRGTGPNMAAGMVAPDANVPELPAWLETLRSSERPGTPTDNNNSKSASPTYNLSSPDLIDERMLPSWMRPERSEASDTGPSAAYPGRRSASKGAPNTDNFAPPQGVMSASSLIDEQALPEWMREKSVSPQQRQKQHQPGVQDNIPAASLVQPEALPEWMRTMQPPAPSNPVQSGPMAIPPEGIMGNDLIDPQSLPNWMAGKEVPKGFSASALLDENALPPWLRNAGQEPQRENATAFPATSQPRQSAPLTPPASPASNQQSQPPTFNNAPPPANLAASSFIDMNALPDWLKPTEGQQPKAGFGQPQQGASEMGRQANFGVPGRPENVRVPSRPRSEMGPYEESEVAANVFASMLGVASASPHLPGQQRGQVPETMQPPMQQPMPQQQWANTANMQGQGVPTGSTSGQNMPVQGMPAGYASSQNLQNQQGQQNPQGPQMNQGYPQAMGGYQGGYAPGNMMGNMPPQQGMPMNMSGAQPGGAIPAGDSQARTNAKPAKRGFLSTILEWFSFSR